MTQPFKICPKCGTNADPAAPTCVTCGHAYRTQFTPPPVAPTMYGGQAQQFQPPPAYHSPAQSDVPIQYQRKASDDIQVAPGSHQVPLACILSIFIIGGGQMVNRQYVKGIMLFLLSGFAFWISFFFLFIPYLVLWGVNIWDSIAVAQRLNRGEVVSQWQFF